MILGKDFARFEPPSTLQTFLSCYRVALDETPQQLPKSAWDFALKFRKFWSPSCNCFSLLKMTWLTVFARSRHCLDILVAIHFINSSNNSTFHVNFPENTFIFTFPLGIFSQQYSVTILFISYPLEQWSGNESFSPGLTFITVMTNPKWASTHTFSSSWVYLETKIFRCLTIGGRFAAFEVVALGAPSESRMSLNSTGVLGLLATSFIRWRCKRESCSEREIADDGAKVDFDLFLHLKLNKIPQKSLKDPPALVINILMSLFNNFLLQHFLYHHLQLHF